MKNVALFTTTRAEFGILRPLIKALDKNEHTEPLLFVGGTHLLAKHGGTINEIKNSGCKITATFDYLSDDSSSAALATALAVETSAVAEIFRNNEIDFVCVVGDRFELLPIVSVAILFKKPIIHIHGGESTEGIIDEQVRHMVTKAAHLHFVACEQYADNVRKMGEQSWRVHNTGALAVDSMAGMSFDSGGNILDELGLDSTKQAVLMTYHPVTLEFSITPAQQIDNIFGALQDFDLQVIVTAPNAEVDADKIAAKIKDHVDSNPSIFYFDSLGAERYYKAVSACEFVIGNSSSGILEVPFFKTPTINIGDRQAGRIRHQSIIDTDYSDESIKAAIAKALSKDFRQSLKDMPYKFGDGNAAQKMVQVINDIEINQHLLRKKLEF